MVHFYIMLSMFRNASLYCILLMQKKKGTGENLVHHINIAEQCDRIVENSWMRTINTFAMGHIEIRAYNFRIQKARSLNTV